MSNTACAMPSISAAVSTRARSSTSPSRLSPPPSSFSAAAPANWISAWLRWSVSLRVVSETPSPFSTRYRPSLAATTKRSGAMRLVHEGLFAGQLAAGNAGLDCGGIADALLHRQPALRRLRRWRAWEATLAFCASLPPSRIALAAMVVATSGLAVSVLPSSSITRPADKKPKSDPPWALRE